MGRGGELTQEGNKRVQAAMFFKVYQDNQLSDLHFETTDSDVKNVTGGMMGSLGEVAKAEEMVRTGSRDETLSIAGDVAVAARTYKAVKDRDDMTVEMYLDQGQMFKESEITPTQKKIMVGLHERRRSKKAVTEWLGSWASMVEKQPHPDQAGLFGATEKPKKSELVDAWIAGKYQEDKQQGLF